MLAIVAVACGLGLWLRLRGLGFGLPAVYNMDEVAIMNRALAFGTGDLNPHNFLYPTFYFYALFAWQGLTFAAGWVMGWWDSVAAFQREFFVDPSRLYWSGRLLSTLCGVATIAAVAALASRLFNRGAAAIAALMMAVMPIAVMDAHYVKHDVPVTLLIVLVHLWLARAVTTEGRVRARDVLVTGALAGLAMSTHYYAVFVALPVAAVLLTQPGVAWADRLRDGLRAGAAATVVFLAASPFLLPELGTAWTDITQNQAIVMGRATESSGMVAGLWRYLTLLKEHGSQPAAWVVSLTGLVLAWQHPRRGLLVTLFPLVFLLFIANTVAATRYLNPILPFLAVGTGVVLAAIARAIASRKWGVVLVAIVTLSQVARGLEPSIELGSFFRQTDTRTLAQRWIETDIPAGASVLVQPYSVPLRQSRESLIEALRLTVGSEERATTKFQQQLALLPYPSPAFRTIYLGDGGLDKDKIYISPRVFDTDTTMAPLKALGVQYVVLKRYNVPDASLASLDRALASGGRIVATFSPYRSDMDQGRQARVPPFLHNTDARLDPALERPGPVIEIWRID